MREVLFYRGPSGTSPVEEFLDGLGPNKARKVTWVLSLIEELEFVPREYLVLVHAFKKKTKKIRKTDIRLAEARRKEYISR